ncbi:MAG: putative membrane protein [Bacteroidetes bacterium HLUCCA01]|nr:MAG: putative membrane protein [Bacteroidetes bacterium HLUCCA01]
MHKFLTAVLVLAVLLVFAADAMALTTPPPPALPVAPDQAPLGGLGLLAAAGGAYAWKKLRNRG